MSALNFIDRYSSTLASAYTSGGTSLVVASAAGLPSGACNFYVIVKEEGANTEEVFHVSDVTGTTLTVAGAEAGSSASDHGSGAVIIGSIMTAAAWAAARASINQVGTYANLPTSGMMAGDRYICTDSVYEFVYSGSVWVALLNGGSVRRYAVLPNDSAFAWVNQSTATYSVAAGYMRIAQSTAGGRNLNLRVKSLPSAPYSITMAVGVQFGTRQGAIGNDYYAGIALRESSSGKLATVSVSINSDKGWFGSYKFNSESSFNSTYGESPYGLLATLNRSNVTWFRVSDDNTNRTFAISVDGYNFFPVYIVGRTDFITPDQIGIFCDLNNNSQDIAISLYSYEQ